VWQIVVAVALGVIAVIALVASAVVRATSNRHNYSSAPGFLGGGLAAVLLALFVLFASITTIDAKNVGVVTVFGKPTETLDNGWHWVPFYSNVTEFDGTIQPLTLAGTEGDDKRAEVRIAGQGVAWLDATLQWQINAEDKAGVMLLFSNYRDPSRLDEQYIERNLRAALVDAFVDYDPIAGLADPNVTVESPTQRNTKALELLQERLTIGGVKLISLTISGIEYDPRTQAKINDFITVAAEKQLAQERVDVAKLLAEANAELAKGATDPGTLFLRCILLTDQWINDGKAIPPGWNCSGSGAVIIAPANQ
jgi:regulator of protease activity HflC (stomatin/prohibitin superfamily)